VIGDHSAEQVIIDTCPCERNRFPVREGDPWVLAAGPDLPVRKRVVLLTEPESKRELCGKGPVRRKKRIVSAGMLRVIAAEQLIPVVD
jgi:hypothetical protein